MHPVLRAYFNLYALSFRFHISFIYKSSIESLFMLAHLRSTTHLFSPSLKPHTKQTQLLELTVTAYTVNKEHLS